jgi:hypothetical protein
MVKKKGRPKGSKNKPKIAVMVDTVRESLIAEITAIYKNDGKKFPLPGQNLSKYTNEQLQIHLDRLKQGHRPWKYTPR